MSDRWMTRSHTFGNCNCEINCGCQFQLDSTHGFCQFVEGGNIVEGYFNDTSLTGLNWAFMISWPGEIAAGNGKEQVVIDERRADADQREALGKIIHGQAGGVNHFAVFSSLCTEVLDPLYLPIECEVDIEATHRTTARSRSDRCQRHTENRCLQRGALPHSPRQNRRQL